MKNSAYCNCCVNKDTDNCNSCTEKNGNKYNFVPRSDVRQYFSQCYVGHDKYEYIWNSTNENMHTETHSVVIHNKHYCPYCANLMFPIQEKNTLKITGYTCFCEGALTEAVYKQARAELQRKYEDAVLELHNTYRPKLIANFTELFAIKQEEEKRYFEFFNSDPRCISFNDNNTIDLESVLL